MTRRLLAALCLAMTLLSGCMGYFDRPLREGDEVRIQLDVRDPATGRLIASLDSVNVTLGASIWGRDLERALLGSQVGDKVSVQSSKDASRNFTALVSKPQELARENLEQTVPRMGFPLMPNTTVGSRVLLGEDIHGEILMLNETSVRFRLVFPADAKTDYPEVGLRVRILVEGDMYRSLVQVLPRPASFQGPLSQFLPSPGTYLPLGTGAGNVTFAWWSPAGGESPDLRFDATLLAVNAGLRGAVASDGEYGRRDSPHVAQGPRSLAPAWSH